jgi:hypothetical protein
MLKNTRKLPKVADGVYCVFMTPSDVKLWSEDGAGTRMRRKRKTVPSGIVMGDEAEERCSLRPLTTGAFHDQADDLKY